MRRASFIPATLLAAFLPTAAAGEDLNAVCSNQPRSHTETITSGQSAYTVRLGGRIDGEMTRDPVGYWAFDQAWEPNGSVRLQNTGDVPVINPWIQRQGAADTHSVRAMVDFVVQPGMSERERARRIWEFVIGQRFHATTNTDEVYDAIKRFNIYGFTLCGPESFILGDFYRAAGLRVRQGYPNGHSTTEVWYDGAWHLLDSDESIICLLRDNKTIASEAQIVDDHDLMKRTHTYGPLNEDSRNRDETSAALHFYEGERKGEHPSMTSHTMNYTLRPGEAITWAWNAGNRFHEKDYPSGDNDGWLQRWRLLEHVMNGALDWTPDLSRPQVRQYLTTRGVEYRATGPFGGALYATGPAAEIQVPVKSAYTIVGGRLEVNFGRADMRAEQVRVGISFDQGKTWKPVWSASNSDFARMDLDLNPFFPREEARYEYLLRFELTSRAPQPAVSIRGFHVTSTLQMAQLALPAMVLGDNRFTYTDESGPGRSVKITHIWNECDLPVVPEPPAGAVAPADGGKAQGTQVTFRWLPPGKGPAPADYEFELSEYPDMRWALSPNFRKLISRTATRGTPSFELPYTGLLNPDQAYYWRVRGRSAEGVWGPWSKTFLFAAVAPAVPVNVRVAFDAARRKVTLGWEPGPRGSAPARYRIYGSAERGFTASDAPFRYNAGNAGTKSAGPNFLMETDKPVASQELPAGMWRAFYRVEAVDAAGHVSGSSDMVELRHPLVVTSALPDATPSAAYQARVEVSSSIGHLTSEDKNGKPYDMMFRTGDRLVFALAHAPSWLTIDAATGALSGSVPGGTAGTQEVEVTVTDQRTGAHDTAKLPLRILERSASAR